MKDKKIEAISSVFIDVSSRAMLRTTITRLAENLPLDMAEDAEVSGNGDSGDDETVEKITFQRVERTYGLKGTIWKATKQSSCWAHASLYNG